jgi:DNA-binding transcriptional LysR family regulator
LESAFGAALFERMPTGMVPTELGMMVLTFARVALGDLNRLVAEVATRRAGRGRSLVVAAAADFLPDVVATAIAEIGQSRPALAVKLCGDPYEDIVNRLMDGRIDLAVGYFGSDLFRDGISYRMLGKETLCVAAREGHPLARAAHLSVPMLERAPWLTHPAWESTCGALDPFCRRAGVKPRANAVESRSLVTTLNLLRKTDAISILPECAVRDALRTGRLARLPVALDARYIEFGVLSRGRDVPNSAVVEFLSILGRLCEDEVAQFV